LLRCGERFHTVPDAGANLQHGLSRQDEPWLVVVEHLEHDLRGLVHADLVCYDLPLLGRQHAGLVHAAQQALPHVGGDGADQLQRVQAVYARPGFDQYDLDRGLAERPAPFVQPLLTLVKQPLGPLGV
jgi:hypothetical protein